jgi:hypothetical protein
MGNLSLAGKDVNTLKGKENTLKQSLKYGQPAPAATGLSGVKESTGLM